MAHCAVRIQRDRVSEILGSCALDVGQCRNNNEAHDHDTTHDSRGCGRRCGSTSTGIKHTSTDTTHRNLQLCSCANSRSPFRICSMTRTVAPLIELWYFLNVAELAWTECFRSTGRNTNQSTALALHLQSLVPNLDPSLMTDLIPTHLYRSTVLC